MTVAYKGVAGNAPIALWVVPVAEIGGVARHVLDVARTGLPRTRMVVLCPPGALAEELTRLGVPVLAESFGPNYGLAASVRVLRHAVAKLRPAIVHTHLAYADIVGALAVPLTGPTKLVSTEHGIAYDDSVYHGSSFKSALMSRAHQVRCERFDALMACSVATADAMEAKWHPRRVIDVLHNGVDAPTAPSQRKEGLRILSLARLAPEKRILELLKGFSLLKRDYPQATLTIAGTGEEEAALRGAVESLGLTDCVDFPGFVDARQALASHDVLAQLSVWENCSYSLLDAVVSGMGVVATPVGGNPEILPSQCLVDAYDVTAIAQALASQGLELEQRPQLNPYWPSVSDMCHSIVKVYQGCFK